MAIAVVMDQGIPYIAFLFLVVNLRQFLTWRGFRCFPFCLRVVYETCEAAWSPHQFAMVSIR